MTSTIYKIEAPFNQVGSVDAVLITGGSEGSGYTSAPTITITSGTGSGATAIANLASTGVNSVIINNGGSFGSADSSQIALVWSEPDEEDGDKPIATVTLSGLGQVNGFIFTSHGSGYTSAPTLNLVPTLPAGNRGSFTPVLGDVSNLGTSVASATVTNGGSDYLTPPTVTFTAPQEAGSTTLGTATISEFDTGENILSSDISITKQMVDYGGGGILRLYFSFDLELDTVKTPGVIGVFNNGLHIGDLNPDNDSEIANEGYYRFDIGIEGGDNINLQLRPVATKADEIVGIDFITAQLVVIGA